MRTSEVKLKGNKLFGILAALTVFISLLAPAAALAAGSSMYVSPDTQTVAPEATFTVNIMIDTDVASRGAQCDINFDPAQVQVVSVAQGTFYSAWASGSGAGTYWQAPTINNTAGLIKGAAVAVTGASGQGPSGSGTFITVTMTAVSGFEGTAAIDLLNTKLSDVNGQAMTHGETDGQVIVGQADSSSRTTSSSSSGASSKSTPTAIIAIAAVCGVLAILGGGWLLFRRYRKRAS